MLVASHPVNPKLTKSCAQIGPVALPEPSKSTSSAGPVAPAAMGLLFGPAVVCHAISAVPEDGFDPFFSSNC